mmetsp:Transcript_23412/g.51740  ORF Transcript_23412/g.51740 Transcript_23412/m.51740 type:complete len:234 (+) Transcript_23412:1578-2279(+)
MRPAKKCSLRRKSDSSPPATLTASSRCSASWSPSGGKRRWMTLVTLTPEPNDGDMAKPLRHAATASLASSVPRSMIAEVIEPSLFLAPFSGVEDLFSIFSSFSAVDNMKSPVKALIVWTLLGSFRSRFPSNCPAATMDPDPSAWWIFPDAVARKDMIIFMASNSTKGSPSSTGSPSACRYRTNLPLNSDRSSDGSRTKGKMIVVPPLMRSRKPSGSSTPLTCVTLSPNSPNLM